MATTYNEQIQQLYVAYFNRPADKAGLDYWESVVEAANGNTAAVSAEFAASTEYKTTYANMTNEQIVDKVYQNLFGRPAEADGKAYWADLLTKGAITIDNVVAQVAGGALTTDKEAYDNKVAYAEAFTKALDTDAEIAAYAKGGDANVAAKALIAGITTDATLTTALVPATLNAAVAKVVAAVTPFSLETAVDNVLSAQEAVHSALVSLADDDSVATQLDTDGADGTSSDGGKTITDAEIRTAIGEVQTAANGDMDTALGTTGFETKSAAMQSAMISDHQAALADTLDTANDDLSDANDAVAKVDGLKDAIALEQATADNLKVAQQADALAKNAQDAAQADFVTYQSSKTVVYTAASHTVTVDGTAVLTYSSTKDAYSLATGASETKYQGLTAFMNSLNATLKADAAASKAADAHTDAFIAADIIDTSDDYAALTALAGKFQFTTLAKDELPTWAQIKAESDIFADKMDALDAKAAANGATDYAGAINALKTAISGATDLAHVKTATTDAVNAGYITSADKTAIDTAAGTDAAPTFGAAATAVDSHDWAARNTAFEDAKQALLDVEDESLTGDAGIGANATLLTNAQTAVDNAQKAIDTFADKVDAYNHGQELGAAVKAADAGVTAAIKVITTEGFAAPVTVNDTINLATSKDDIFIIGTAGDVSIRSMGVLGTDTLYVGKDLTYNKADIGTGTGQVSLSKAGNDSVLEFFLKETTTGVDVIVETKAFGSSEAGTADLITVHLVGVDIDHVNVANGFITVGQ